MRNQRVIKVELKGTEEKKKKTENEALNQEKNLFGMFCLMSYHQNDVFSINFLKELRKRKKKKKTENEALNQEENLFDMFCLMSNHQNDVFSINLGILGSNPHPHKGVGLFREGNNHCPSYNLNAYLK